VEGFDLKLNLPKETGVGALSPTTEWQSIPFSKKDIFNAAYLERMYYVKAVNVASKRI
jgi:hypothetical protein